MRKPIQEMSQLEMSELAEILRNKSNKSYENSAKSFERCDTDGFLTQGASDNMGRLYSAQATMLEKGCKTEFIALFDENNVEVDAKVINGTYGPVWYLSKEAGERYGRRYVPIQGKRQSRIQKELGLHEGTVVDWAWTDFADNGMTGLAGMASLSIRPFRLKKDWYINY